ncbi:MAG: lysophospholipid acyltransferase family protein [Ramlibacter sp.]
MNALRALWRLGRALVHVLSGLATIVWVFPHLGAAQREGRVQAWAQAMLAVLGIRLEVRGRPPGSGPVLLVANHISWLDIVVMHAARHCRFVAKAQVRHWPLIGRLASAAGTLYIERESRRDALRVVHHIAECLRAGDVLAVFPEGTTSDGTRLLPFHANLLQAAISANAPALPLALSFVDTATRAPSLAPAYVGDDTLLGSVWRTVTAPPLTAMVSYGEPQFAQGLERRQWAAQLRLAVEAVRTG